MVPLSVATAAATPARLQALMRLSAREAGAPVSLALVDCDGTVIVSYLHAGLVPPEVLTGPEEPEDDDDGELALPATITAEDAGAAKQGLV